MTEPKRPIAKGRGAQIKPPNRFARIHVEDDFEQLEYEEEFHAELGNVRTEYFVDSSKSIISENNSPDIPYRYSLNAYRGCLHGCSYCYARPTHEYLDLNAGLDFESKIFVKERAGELLQDWLARDAWQPETIMMSGITDCYQPAERQFELTRRCLRVALDARQPISIITKNALVTRDLDLLSDMAELNLVRVAISLTSLDQSLTRVMEPRTSSPAARLRAIRELHEARVPVGAMLAPIIPGLNDSEIPALLKAAKDAGADSAAFVLLRLPLSVRPVFLDWLERTQPEHRERIESRIRSTREGGLNDSQFGNRMRGTGQIAEQIQQSFRVFAKKSGLNRKPTPLDKSQFLRPQPSSGQLRLFR